MERARFVLELDHVNKNFDLDFPVIKDVDFKVKPGEFVCLIGPSGCGKTVLLYTIAGFLAPTSGQVLMNDKIVDSISPERMMVFQDHMLFPWKTVLENVLFGLTNFKYKNSKKTALAKYYLSMVDLWEFKDWPIHKLSGGMKQRVAFARALITDPKILLMDEPFSALDSMSRKHLRKNLIEIWQKTNKTIIFVTHSMDEAIYFADTIHVMSARPTSIKKSYSVNLPRPRNMSDPAFVKLLEKLEKDIANEFRLNQAWESEPDIDNILINNL